MATVNASPASEKVEIKTLSRVKSLHYSPCERCHDNVPIVRDSSVVNPHSRIVVSHMEGGQNCATCHDRTDPASLTLASGQLVSIDRSFELCNQCHNDKVSDWKVGIHGKQVGNWQKVIHRYACGHCHDPHKPAYVHTKTLPPPPFPELGIEKKGH